MTAGASLSVENGVVANFPGPGIYVASTSKVSILDTTLRDNGFGIHLQGGAVGAISKTTISGSTNTGIYLYGGIGGTTTTATISDTTISDSYFDGIRAFSNVPNANVYAAVVRSTLSNNGYLGISVDANVASTVLLTLSESMVARSSIGLYANDSNAGVKLETLGNNTVRQNGTNTSGTIAAVPLL